MATWPANGETDWNTKMLAYLAIGHDTDGTHKASEVAPVVANEGIFGDSTSDDDDGNALAKAHAYTAPTDGIVKAWTSAGLANKYIRGYVGDTDDPAGIGTMEDRSLGYNTEDRVNISFEVPKGKYWEVTSNTNVTIRWRAIGTLSEPVDQG